MMLPNFSGEIRMQLKPESVLFSEISLPYVIPNYRVVDVDTLEDWQHAEFMNQANNLFNKQFDESSNSR